MHKFRPVKDCELTQTEKEQIWQKKVSGSMLYDLITDYQNTKRRYIDPSTKVEFINKIRISGHTFQSKKYNKAQLHNVLENKKAVGNFVEETIINWAQVVLEKYLQGKEIKRDKKTYISIEDPLLTANIDGYIGADINNVDTIVEVKNIESPSKIYTMLKMDSMGAFSKFIIEKINLYKWQVMYYCWFFNAKNVLFLFFINGFYLYSVTLDYNLDYKNIIFSYINKLKSDLGAN